MPTPTIEKIRNLKNVGVFSDCNIGGFPHKFEKFNLIYGFNGCGKTTLSRIFAMLCEDRSSENLPDKAEFSFILSDGSTPSHDKLDCALNRHIAVFNEDYIEKSLMWKVGTARPIIYLGKEQSQLAQQLAEYEAVLADSVSVDLVNSRQFASDNRAFETLCTDAARLIAEQLSLGRTYNATNLKSDYASSEFSPDDGLSEEDIKNLRTTVLRAEVPAKTANISIFLDGDTVQAAVQSALQLSISDVAIEALQRRKDALEWVNAGVHLHVNESDCLFCGNPFTDHRSQSLKQALQAAFGNFAENLDHATKMANEFGASCRNFREQLSDATETLPQYKSSIDYNRSVVNTLVSEAEATAAQWIEQLSKKRTTPDEMVKLSSLAIQDWNGSLASAVIALNTQISANNAAIDNFDIELERAKTKLKRHYLFHEKSAFNQAKLASQQSETKYKAGAKLVAEHQIKIAEVRSKLRTHGPAADKLNTLLHSYLGHKHISVEAVEEGYRICRDGRESTKPLSEGEKTAIAFCYFLTALNSEGRKIKDLVVVLDDPISSLDARAMTHVVGTVRQNFQNPAQLFILTHNLDFLREMKKWLYPKNKKDSDKLAAFLFIETGILNNQRSSAIIELPRLIREYDSEYHYLYSLVKSLADDPSGAERFAYLMPNAIRKVLEIFVAFKVPGSGGVEPKLDNLIQANPNLDGARMKAMERLAQLESHSDNIGDVVSFSAYTLHQVADAATCLMALIEELDSGHKKAMDGLCR